MLLKKVAMLAIGLSSVCAIGTANAQADQENATAGSGNTRVEQAQTTPAAQPAAPEASPAMPTPEEKQTWNAPFGGSWAATFTFITDYSYRGISQTQRQVAFQAAFGYETAPVSEKVPLSAYVGVWGSSLYFPNTPTWGEVDLMAGLKLKLLDDKLLFDLGYTRYNYLGAPADLFYDFNEYSLLVGYDFGVASVTGAVRYSPSFFGNSGVAWYKWGQVSVPLNFIKLGDDFAFKLYGTIGNQYVNLFTNYGIGQQNYWDWQVGLTATVYGFDLTVAYVDTNLDIANCGNTQNCQARAIFSVSKTF